MKYRTSEIVVGMVSLLALIILIAITVNLKKSTIFSRKYPLTAYFRDVKRLEEGAPVLVHGVVRGDVRQIRPSGRQDYPVSVMMMLTTGTVLHQGALPRVIAAGLVGETEINIEDSSPTAPALGPGDELYGVHVMSIGDLMAEAPTVVRDLQESVGAISDILTDPRFRQSLTATMDSASSITARIDRLLGTSSLDVTEAIRNIRQAAEQLNRVVARFDSVLTTVGVSLSDTGTGLNAAIRDLQKGIGALVGELTSATQRIDETAQKASRLIATADGILSENRGDARRAIEGLTSTSIHLGQILKRIDSGQGTVMEVLIGPQAQIDLSGSLRGLRDSLEIVGRWLEGMDTWLTGKSGPQRPLLIPYDLPSTDTKTEQRRN